MTQFRPSSVTRGDVSLVGRAALGPATNEFKGLGVQRSATAAAPTYLDRRGRPGHPRDRLGHACLRGRFASGVLAPWEFERDSEIVRVDRDGPLRVRIGAATDIAAELRFRVANRS